MSGNETHEYEGALVIRVDPRIIHRSVESEAQIFLPFSTSLMNSHALRGFRLYLLQHGNGFWLSGKRLDKPVNMNIRSCLQRTLLWLMLGTIALMLCLILVGDRPVNPSFPPELISMLQDVKKADGYQYNAVDSQHVLMRSAKIISSPEGYLAVYHDWVKKRLQVRLALSYDLLHWHFMQAIEKDASQPTIAKISKGNAVGFIVSYEKNTKYYPNGNFDSALAFKYYPNITALFSNRAAKVIVLARSLSFSNEGTPNIYQITLKPDIYHSIIVVGFHFFSTIIVDSTGRIHSGVDREGIGTLTNFSSSGWRAQYDTNLNVALDRLGLKGDYGRRDSFVYQEASYALVEGQAKKDDRASWHSYLYSMTYHSFVLLNIHTSKGSKTFANPTFTVLFLPDGQLGFVSTEYIHPKGAAPGEAGELIYYKAFPSSDNATLAIFGVS